MYKVFESDLIDSCNVCECFSKITIVNINGNIIYMCSNCFKDWNNEE